MIQKTKIYKLSSSNTNQYYIGTSTEKSCPTILSNLIIQYKIYHNYHDSLIKRKDITPPIWHDSYTIIDKNNVTIETLHSVIDENVDEYLKKYDDELNVRNTTNTLINKLENVIIEKNVKKRDYYKKYYNKNKDFDDIKKKNKEYYQKNKDKIKEKKMNKKLNEELISSKKYKKTVREYMDEIAI